MRTTALDTLYRSYRAAVERQLESLGFPREPAIVYDPIRYVLSGGGKRLRAVLVLLACEAAGGRASRAMPAAVAVELLHNFTLVHDDVMDHAALRRGRPTVHRKWDEMIAILAGDELIAQAYRFLGQTKTPRLARITALYTDALVQVCEGQGLDKEFECRADVSRREYLRMVDQKTGRVISAALEIGSQIGGANPARVRSFREFGMYLGRAFQVRDDVLDITGTAEEFGKAIGGDIVEGKKTYLLVRALEQARGSDRLLLDSIRSRMPRRRQLVDDVRGIYERLGVLGLAQEEIERCTQRARNALRPLPPSRALSVLRWLADQLLSRTS